MDRRIHAFGGDGAHEVQYGNGRNGLTEWIRRDLWFDRDLDGKWIVWAQKHHSGSQDGAGDLESDVGSIVVTNPTVVAFIELLGELLVEPTRFTHDPRFDEIS